MVVRERVRTWATRGAGTRDAQRADASGEGALLRQRARSRRPHEALAQVVRAHVRQRVVRPRRRSLPPTRRVAISRRLRARSHPRTFPSPTASAP